LPKLRRAYLAVNGPAPSVLFIAIDPSPQEERTQPREA
jgi:hypothetical protein